MPDGLVRIDELAGRRQGPAAGAGVTDLANMFCMVRFYKAARGKGSSQSSASTSASGTVGPPCAGGDPTQDVHRKRTGQALIPVS